MFVEEIMKQIMEKSKKAYEKIIKLLNQNKEYINIDISSIERTATVHLHALELKEKYGLNINLQSIHSTDYNTISDYISIGFYDGDRRKISWSDNGEQPQGETLLRIGFSTGAYIFGQEYPVEIFNKFWQELKTYNPDYSDTSNHNLYFKLENAKDVFNNFNTIFQKYRDRNNEHWKAFKINQLEKELNSLKQA